MKRITFIIALTAVALPITFLLSGCGVTREIGSEMRRATGLQPAEPRPDWWLRLTGKYGKPEPPPEGEEAPK